MSKCKHCYWNLYRNVGDVSCTSEDETLFEDDTQYTDKCRGFLDKNFEPTFWNTYERLKDKCDHLNLAQLQKVENFIDELKGEK